MRRRKKRTRREVFLEKMEQVVPWAWLMEVIEPYYPQEWQTWAPTDGVA